MAGTQVAEIQHLDQGYDLLQLISSGGKLKYSLNNVGGIQVSAQLIAADGAINAHKAGFYMITKASAAALTIAAPTAGTDDGMEIEIISATSFAHVITAPAGTFVVGGSALNTVLTLTAANGAGTTVYLTAFNGKWYVANGGFGTITPS